MGPSSGRSLRRGVPLSVYLIAMCLAVLLPAIAIGAVGLWLLSNAEQSSGATHVLGAVQDISNNTDRELLGYERLAGVLAASPRLQAGDVDGFENRIRTVQSGQGWFVILTDRNGQTLIDSSLPAGRRVSEFDLDLRTVLATAQVHVTDLFTARGEERRPLVGVQLPIKVNGNVAYGLTLAIPAEQLMGPLLQTVVDGMDMTATIADRKGWIIARSQKQAEFVGTQLATAALDQVNRRADVLRTTTTEGVDVIRAVHRSAESGWIVEGLVPIAALAGASPQSWSRFAALSVALLAMSTLLAAVFSARIVTPIHDLARIAEHGRMAATPRTGLAEVDQVGAALVRSMRELGASEERLRLALTAAGAGVWEYDFALKTARWSPEMIELYGLPARSNPPSRELFLSLIAEDDRDRIRAESDAQVQAGGPFRTEFRLRRYDGREIWVSSRGFVEMGPHGRPRMARGIDQDITAAKAADTQREVLLRQTGEQLDELTALYNTAPIGLALLDRDFRFQRINRVMAEMNGLPADAHIGRSIWEILPHLREVLEPYFCRILDTGEPMTDVEVPGGVDASAGIKQLRLEQYFPLKAADGTTALIGIISEEITERRRAQIEQAHLAAIVESAVDAILSLTPEGRIRSWNPGAERMFGYTLAEAIGQKTGFLVPPESKEYPRGLFDRLIAGERLTIETIRRRKDGTDIPVSVSGAPMRDEKGRIIAASVTIRDISEQRRRDEHTRFIMRELSHRSKNLLAVIQAMARQTARTSRDLDDFQRRFTARVASLAQSHDLLVQQDWRGVPVAELVQAQLAAFVDPAEPRVLASGPNLWLRPEAAQIIGLALHELATNASKYGALSLPQGRIGIDWTIEQRDQDRRFLMSWREFGGPAVVEPIAHGFGHTVVEAMVGRSLDGEAALEWLPDGLIWRLDVPATCLAPELRSVTGVGFLEDTAAYELQAFGRIWSSLKGKSTMPRLAALNLDIVPGANSVFIAAVINEGGAVRFQHERIGTELTAKLANITDPDLHVQGEAAALGELAACYDHCRETLSPCHERKRIALRGNHFLSLERLVLPFSEDGTDVSHLVGMVMFDPGAVR